MLSPLFFPTRFHLLTFLYCCCVVQCLYVPVPSMVISPTGRSGKWRTCNPVRTVFPYYIPSPRSGLFLAVSFSSCSFCGSTNSIFEQCSLLFFFPTHFYPWTFLCCCCGAVVEFAYAFNGDLSKWQVGKVTDMAGSTYTFFFPFFSVAALIFCLNNALLSFSKFFTTAVSQEHCAAANGHPCRVLRGHLM